MSTGTPLELGSYAGHQTYHYIDTMQGSYDADDQTDEDATWVELVRASNFQDEDGRALSEVIMNGATFKAAVAGQRRKSGSFDYHRRYGTDTVWTYLHNAVKNNTVVLLRVLDKAITVDGAKGEDIPILLGEISTRRNGDDDVMTTFAYQIADAYKEDGTRHEVVDVTISV